MSNSSPEKLVTVAQSVGHAVDPRLGGALELNTDRQRCLPTKCRSIMAQLEAQDVDWVNRDEVGDEVWEQSAGDALVRISVVKISRRDFVSEVRPALDTKSCFQDMVVLLDLEKYVVENIVSELTQQIVAGREKQCVVEEVASLLFADKEGCIFSETIQGMCPLNDGRVAFDESWMIALCTIPSLQQRRVGIARMKHPVNLGRNAGGVRLFALVLAPVSESITKSAPELGKTLATLFSDIKLRSKLCSVSSRSEFIGAVTQRSEGLSLPVARHGQETKAEPIFNIFSGLCENIKRRGKYYLSDYLDGLRGENTLHKVSATTFFLYFLCILSCIAFGVLNSKNTRGKIDADRALIGQAVGGLVWAFVAGQPLVIIATTAPLALCNKVVFDLSEVLEVEYYVMYAWVGLWNAFFLVVCAFLGLSSLMKFCTRSVEEIFGVFSFVCFTFDALKDMARNFGVFYFSEACSNETIANALKLNESNNLTLGIEPCQRESSLLYLLLMVGTTWLALTIYQFKDTPYLTAGKREILSDYALPIAVVVFSFVGTCLFSDVPVETFKITGVVKFKAANLGEASGTVIGISAVLGFAISLLFFMDQGISAQMVAAPTNKLKKGNAHHYDFLCVALINICLSMYGLPWMHGLLPHCPLHVQSLADFEEKVDEGHVRRVVVRSRETRLTGIFCHILIAISVLFIPFIFAFIPVPVLNGLFLYCAVASIRGNSFYERITLIFTEQSAYPPTHYVRRCPKKSMHWFTLFELIQFGILCFVGYAPWPYLQITFPLFIGLLMPIRHLIIPLVLEKKYLEALDSYH